MRILYVGKHGQADGNDDEGAIAYVLRELGHEVNTLGEDNQPNNYNLDCDLLLYHKWDDPERLARVSARIKVCWYFDLVSWPFDPTLQRRSDNRISWMRRMMPGTDVLFCTDGDWAEAIPTMPFAPKRTVWLPQGADERIVGLGTQRRVKVPILMTGIARGGGRERESFVREVSDRWQQNFLHVVKGLYRTQLRDLIAGTAVVICPDSPVTDRYWSNRVWNTVGFGAFVLHPYCHRLAEMLEDGKEVVFYSSRDDLHAKIARYLVKSDDRSRISYAGMERILKEHTYRSRIQRLLQVVEEMT